MRKILFLTEKWTDVDPLKPITNNNHNLFGSLEKTGLATHSCLYYDEFYYLHNKSIDEHFVEVVDRDKPDAVIIMLIPWFPHCPSVKSYEIVSKLTKLVFIWPDGIHCMGNAAEVEPYSSLMVLWDTDVDWKPNTKYIHLWTPQDPQIFNDPNLDRDIGVSFVGNPNYPDRMAYISSLKSAGVDLHITGGRYKINPLDVESYAGIMKRSKITLNFSLFSTGQPQLKGRIFEAMACGAMLMESSNCFNWIERWFIPDIHYVSFTNKDELINKTKYYLANDSERSKIAKNGWRQVTDHYNNYAWWSRVFYEINI